MKMRKNTLNSKSKEFNRMTCKKFVCLIVMIVMAFGAALPAFAAGGSQEGKTIKVGYMDHPGFIEKDKDGNFKGYGVEYLDEICKYTGWNIEYVYASWSDQLKMLERGELDIVPMAQYSEERAKRFNYTHQSVGIIQGLLLTLPTGQGDDIENNALACDGKTIGIQRGSRNIELLDKYAKHMGFSYKKVEYDYQSELEAALYDGDVDIIACEQMIESEHLQILDRFASDPYYLITAKGNTELIEELDYIISNLNAYDPTYTAKLYEKYFGDGLTSNHPYFTKDEMEFIKSCGEVTIVLIPNSKPQMYTDENDKIVGIIPDIMSMISEFCGIRFNYVFLPEDKTPLEFIGENPDYIAAGVISTNPAFDSDSVLLSDVYCTTYSELVTHDGNLEHLDLQKGDYTIGTLTSFQAMNLFIQENYPNMKICGFPNAEAGLQALEDGQIDLFSYTDNIINPLLSNPRYADIDVVDSRFMKNELCNLGMNTPENRILFGIMDKCISVLPEDRIAMIESDYIQKNIYQFEGRDAIHRYRDIIALVVLIVLGVFALLVTFQLIRQRRFNREITLHAEYDMMTGVYNRVTLKDKLQNILEQSPGSGGFFLIIDVDGLKLINDTRGQAAGDEAIKGLANILKAHFDSSALIGRTAGDEFGVFLTNVNSKTVMVSILTRLQRSISAMVIANGTAVIGVSIGVTMCKEGADTVEELYRRAEEALRRIKENGKNGFAFYESKKALSMNEVARNDSGELVEESPAKSPSEALQKINHISDEAGIESYEECDSNFRKLFDAFPNVGVYVIESSTRRVLFFNKRLKEIYPKISIGANCRSLNFGPCQNCIVDTMREQRMAHTIFYSDSFGDEVEITATKVMWENKIPAVMISRWPRNILTSSDDSLPRYSNHDTFDYVTGGLTRSGFIRMIERMQGGGVDLTEYALLFINIKEFKAVNEMVGSDGGDNLLQTVFTRVELSSFQPILGARKESDHFVFMVEKNALDLSALPELLNFHWQYEGKDLFIHCRCGVFKIEDGELEVYKMIDRAKLAKEHIVDDFVKPYAVFDSSMLEEYSENAAAFLFFDTGIKNNEFVVYYQPVVDAKTGKLVSAEALVRRRTADGTIISPGKFLPILERTGYVSMLDRFVALEVRAFMYKRKDAGLPIVPIAFNISQKDFYDASFMEMLAEYLETSTLPKGSVMLEITEGVYTLNEKKHEDYLKRLRASGAKILLDDFGTGYSSFGMFDNYNFDRVKLDMSFVRKLEDNDNVRKVVDSIISMCHNLGIQVVAEGVETEGELAILREMDCDFIQGYYFSKPLDEESFVEYINKHI